MYRQDSFASPPLPPPVPELQPDSAADAPPAPPPASDPSPNPPDPPESEPLLHRWPGLDGPGATQAIGGLAVGLIALLSSYDHITFLGHIFPLPQQWGIPIIATSVAIIFIDAELATRSRLRAAQDAARLAHATARERYFAGEERQRADRERDRAAEARKRQAESLERLDQAALLSGRFQLDPSAINRARFRAFLTLMAQQPIGDEDLS